MTRETYTDLEEAIVKLNSQKEIFVMQKKDYELELSTLNSRVRSREEHLEQNEYQSICRRQNDIKKGINEMQKILSEYKGKIQEKQVLKEKLRNELNLSIDVVPNIIEQVILLKDKYRAFSSDQTRVSSMRVMASQICSDLELIIKNK